MLRGGHPPFLLRVLFAGWVLSPFVALMVADGYSKWWTAAERATLHGVTLVLAAGALACYRGVIPMPRDVRPAFVFLAVPAGMWLLLIVVGAAALLSRRPSRRGSNIP